MDLRIKEKRADIFRDELPVIHSYQPLLFVLYKNLIENGLKYNVSEKPEIKIEYNEDSYTHFFTIEDNGIGIAEEHKNEVFEMFKRLHSRSEYGGSGMGLSICKKILVKLGGDINIVKSSPAGTTFQITIPKEAEPSFS